MNDEKPLSIQRDEERRRNAAPRVNDHQNNPGRFDLFERRKREDQARLDAHRRDQAVALLRRTLGREPTPEEVEAAVNC